MSENTFKPGSAHIQEQRQPSVAEVAGIKPPALTDAQKAGQRINAASRASAFNQKLADYEQWKREKAEFEKARDAAIWQRIEEKQRNAV